MTLTTQGKVAGTAAATAMHFYYNLCGASQPLLSALFSKHAAKEKITSKNKRRSKLLELYYI